MAQLNPNGSPGNQFSRAAWGLMPPTRRWCSSRTTTPSTPAPSATGTATCSGWRTCGCWPSRTAIRRSSRATCSTARAGSMGPPSDGRVDAPRHLRREPGDGDRRPVGVRAPRPSHPHHGRLPPRRRGHRREPLVGQRRQRYRLFARRQGIRRDQPGERRRSIDGRYDRIGGGHLLRPAHGRRGAACAGTTIVVNAAGSCSCRWRRTGRSRSTLWGPSIVRVRSSRSVKRGSRLGAECSVEHTRKGEGEDVM